MLEISRRLENGETASASGRTYIMNASNIALSKRKQTKLRALLNSQDKDNIEELGI